MIEGSLTKALLDGVPAVLPGLEKAAQAEAKDEEEAPQGYAKRIALFLAAPFIGLLYIVALPVVGMATLTWMGLQPLLKKAAAAGNVRFLKNAGMLVAAPFIGLAFVVLLPVAGSAMLAWTGVMALRTKPQAE
jgi:hypothetical protein